MQDVDALKQEIQQLKQKNTELEFELSMEKQVKDSEKLMNHDLKEYNKKLELQLETVVGINYTYAEKIAKLQMQLKKLYGI